MRTKGLSMRYAVLSVLLTLHISGYGFANKPSGFKHHTFEFSLTPAFDYYFITNANQQINFKQNFRSSYHPFGGCNFGLTYIYRPIKLVSFSTGLNYLEYVNRFAQQGNVPVRKLELKGYEQRGFIGIPILAHLYNQTNKAELDWATGPEFSFPVYYKLKYSNLVGESKNIKQVYNSTQTGQQSLFGWDVEVTASIPVKNAFYVSIGPVMKFISAYSMYSTEYYSLQPHIINYYVGIKACFRFGTDFSKKIEKGTSQAKLM